MLCFFALLLLYVAPLVASRASQPPILNGIVPPIPLSNIKFGKTRPNQFVHPGLWHTHEDLERMRTAVAAGREPWVSTFAVFANDTYSQGDYEMEGPFPVISRGLLSNYTSFTHDTRAAWQNALMWYITRDEAHWTTSTTILDAWGSGLEAIIGIDASLLVGLEGQFFANAAEIMRWEGNWTEAGATYVGGSGFSVQLYWLFERQSLIVGQANYGMASIAALFAFAAYLDDVSVWNYALNEYQNGLCGGIYGMVDPTTGQLSESGRDQGHVQVGLEWAAWASKIVQSQGGDMFGLDDNLLLKGFEYAAKYNLNNTVPFDPSFYRCESVLVDGPWSVISNISRDLTKPIWDLAYYEFGVNRGLNVTWTEKAKDAAGMEISFPTADLTSWGGLVWAR
ncbi:chondroitin AC/alginate lyase [Mycena latifolia]|nr:chondroitin AC/alginate lyase [Mycena latifolia]